MTESKIFICHAGADIALHAEADNMGIVGMAYVWDGEWIRSPEDVGARESSPIMKLRPLLGPDVVIWGDTPSYTEASQALDLCDPDW